MFARSHSRCSRLARLLFTLLMTLAWCGALPAFVANVSAQTNAGREAAAEEQRQQKSLAVLRRLCDLGEEVIRNPDANPADIPAQALRLGNDPQRLFEFVRNEIIYEPYRGILRGARGALASRAGNALDKSLLLQKLLECGGQPCRLVRGKLAPDKAAALVDQFLGVDPLKGPLGLFVETGTKYEVPADFARRSGMSEALLKEYFERSRRQSEAFLADAWKATDAQSAYLGEQLAKANVTLGRSTAAWKTELAARAAEHAWVEIRTSDDTGAAQWVTLDPSFAAAERGQVFGTEGAPAAAEKLAADRHTIRFALVYRTDEAAGAPKEHILLDETLPVDNLFWEPPAFTIDPADPLPPPSKLLEMKPDDVIKLLASVERFQGVLTSGGKRFASRGFDTKGQTFEAAANGRFKGAAQVGAALGGVFGGLDGGADAKPANIFTDLSVLITLQAPGAEPIRQRRVLLTKQDVIGEHVLSPILGWQILVQPGLIAAAVNDFQRLRGALPVLDPMVSAMQANEPERALDRMSSHRESAHPALLADLALWRQAATARLVQDNPKLRPLWDRPQLAIAEQRFCANKKTGHGCGRAAIDIVDNAISMIPSDDASSAPAAQAALKQGVFDTAAEALLLKSIVGDNAEVRAAIDDAEQARLTAGDLAVFAPADAASSAGALPDADKAWITQFEAPGRRILAPRTAVASGAMWWSLDPETGSILGRGAGGRGQTMTEYAIQIWIGNICMIIQIANFMMDTRQGASGKQKAAFLINVAGCLLGVAGGAAGVKLAAGAAPGSAIPHVINLINAGIAGAVSLGSGAAAR